MPQVSDALQTVVRRGSNPADTGTVVSERDKDTRPGDDPRSSCFGNASESSLEIGLLAELRAALADYEINSELREDLACLAVKRPGESVWLWVFVSFGGRYFSWNNAQRQHPVRDIPGAARRIVAQLGEPSVSGTEAVG